jgi:hypothetical protein
MAVMRALLVAILLLAGGCANYRISANSGGTATAASSSGIYVSTSGGAAVFFAAVMLGAMAAGEDFSRDAPELDPQRSIDEQDCTRPVASSGNLRCR